MAWQPKSRRAVDTENSSSDFYTTTVTGTSIGVATEVSIGDATNAIGEPDGNLARLSSDTDVLVLDLGQVVPAGTIIEITALKTDADLCQRIGKPSFLRRLGMWLHR